MPVIIELPPPTDLAVASPTDIVIPGPAMSGEPVTIEWTVTNVSADVAASGTWSDSVYLSEDAIWDIGDRPMGRVSFTGALEPGEAVSLAVLHDERLLALVIEEVVHRHDAGMSEARRRDHFGMEESMKALVEKIGPHDLHRDGRVLLEVAAAPHLAHAAAPEELLRPIALPEHDACFQRHAPL